MREMRARHFKNSALCRVDSETRFITACCYALGICDFLCLILRDPFRIGCARFFLVVMHCATRGQKKAPLSLIGAFSHRGMSLTWAACEYHRRVE